MPDSEEGTKRKSFSGFDLSVLHAENSTNKHKTEWDNIELEQRTHLS
jgi:hypothetical protein